MWKSYRLRRYHWIATLLEFCLPIVITYIMLRNLGSEKKYKVHDAIIYDEISLEELTQSAQKFEKLHYTPSNNFTDKLMNSVINSLKLSKFSTTATLFIIRVDVSTSSVFFFCLKLLDTFVFCVK